MAAPELEPLLAWGRGLGHTAEPRDVGRRPWSTTARVGDVWLKACGPAAAYEAAWLAACRGEDLPQVVLPVDADPARGYLVLPHAGDRLRGRDDAVDVWRRVLAEHAALHRALQPRAEEAVALGVPDLRPARLPAALDALRERAALPPELRAALASARPALVDDVEALADGPVAPCVQHDDLHDGNVLVSADGTASVVDWGDAAVSHPFGVLLVTLRSVAARGAGPAEVRRLRDAYLEPWTDLAPRADLVALADAAVRVQPLLRALAWERALSDADGAERAGLGDPVAGWLEVLAGLDD